jgi:hypothetical protein
MPTPITPDVHPLVTIERKRRRWVVDAATSGEGGK